MSSQIWTDNPLMVDPGLVDKPKEEEALWEKSVYPIGNGRLGCTAFGEPARERILFNLDSIWVGNEDSTGGYQPFGDIYLDFGHQEYRDYRRELDLEQALQVIQYSAGGVRYRREYFASYPAQTIVLRFSADCPGALSGVISMGNVHGVPIVAEEGTLVMKGDTGNFYLWRLHLADPKRLLADREYASDKNIDLDFEARVRVLHEGGTVRTNADTIVFDSCDRLTLLLAADTNYLADRSRGWRGEHPHDRVCAWIRAAEQKSWLALFDEHLADYQSLYKRMSLDLGNSPESLRTIATADRVKMYGEHFSGRTRTEDRELEVLLYNYARYLMISSSRPGHGGLPANLQGIWLINKRPSWRCDFHTDVNVQMNYWFTSASNLTDCFEPLARWIDSIRDVRKEETRRVLGVQRGWLMRSENGIFGGSTWHIQKGDSAWLCQNLWDHYTFTMDKNFLKRYAYPVLKEISEFWIDHLKELPDGTLVAPNGRSPEHGPVGVDGVSYDQQLCAELFTNTIEAADALGVDAEFQDELRQKLAKLLVPKIGRWGQFQEWLEDIDAPEDDHRHINHLIGVYPGRQVDPVSTPELAAAAKTSLIARRDHGQGHPAWSRVWKASMFARLLDGDAAYGQISETLATHIYANMWAVHPPFQIDANFGYAAAVNEMLVQSHRQDGEGNVVIHLLPALPKAWPAGEVRGLRTRGGFEADIIWSEHRISRAVVRGISNPCNCCCVLYGEVSKILIIPRGDEKLVEF